MIVYIAMADVICGAESWYEIEKLGRSRKNFLTEPIPSLIRIPSHDTFNRFLAVFL